MFIYKKLNQKIKLLQIENKTLTDKLNEQFGENQIPCRISFDKYANMQRNLISAYEENEELKIKYMNEFQKRLELTKIVEELEKQQNNQEE